MTTPGKELLGEYYGRDHITHEEMEKLGLAAVTEDGEFIGREDMRGRIFRVENPDEPSGYIVKNMEETGERTELCFLREA